MNQMEARIFGYFVAVMRRKQEWTLEALAHATHYSYSMIRSIEKGTSRIDKEGRDRFARLFGFSGFSDNWNEKEAMCSTLKSIQDAHASLMRKDRDERLDAIIKDTSLIASYLFPEYLLAVLFQMVVADEPETKIRPLREALEPALEFFTVKELGLYYDLLGMNVEDQERETEYFHQAFLYDPDSFLINLHMAMNAMFRQHLVEAKTYLERCRSLVFQVGSYPRFIQVAALEAQIRIDSGDIDSALSSLHAMCQKELKTIDPYSYARCVTYLAYGSMRKNDMSNALRYAQKALKETPDTPLLHLIAVYASFRSHDPRFLLFVHDAKDRMRPVDPFDRNMPWNNLIDALTAWHDQDLFKAIGLFERCCSVYTMDPLRAWMLECLIELTEAAQDLPKALKYQKQLTDLLLIRMK